MAAATGSDIHATSPRDTFTGVAARSVPVTRTHPVSLPTPPNSISPALPPHGLKAQLQKAAASKLEPIDSDLDLQDAVDEKAATRGAHRRPSVFSGTSDDLSMSSGRVGIAALANAAAATAGVGSPPYESADAITPAMLAKFHLPEILLNHGPLAIRYIIGHLTASVPGFSFIPPAKSRRLVVAALEGRGNGVEGGLGGLEGDVEFQKVSWGIWSARRLGSGRPQASSAAPNGLLGIPIASGGGGVDASKGEASRYRQLNKGMAGPGAAQPDDYDDMYMENEADKMSMDDDGSASASCSEAPDDDVDMMDDDPADATDDEDWGTVGAAALRAASYSNSAGPYSDGSFLLSRPSVSVSNFTATASSKRSFSYSAARPAQPPKQPSQSAMGFAHFHGASGEQEREAVEALLRLGSV